MADETTPETDFKKPPAFASLQGYMQGDPQVKTTRAGKEFVSMRMRVIGDRKDDEGKSINSFVKVDVFNKSHVDKIKRDIEAGKAKDGGHLSVEGSIEADTYESNGQKRKEWIIKPRLGPTAVSCDKPAEGKGKRNDIEVKGTLREIEVKTITGKSGEPMDIINMSVMRTENTNWSKPEEPPKLRHDWFDVSVLSPANVTAMKGMMEEGKLAVGATVGFKAGLSTERWTDKDDGKPREKLGFLMKTFPDAITVIKTAEENANAKAAKENPAAETQAEASIAGEPAKKGKGRGKAAATPAEEGAAGKPKPKKRNVEDEIPF